MTSETILINPQIFREYDIRGIVDRDLSTDFAYLLGRAYATLAKEHGKDRIAVGHDCRHSSEPYARALLSGLSDEGVSGIYTGLGPTPQVYYSLFNRDYGGGIQVTGSHNPSNMNGFKMCLGQSGLAGDAIQDLRARMSDLAGTAPTAPASGEIHEQDLHREYVDDLITRVKPHMGSRKVKVVVDAGNGMGGVTGPEVLRGIGADVVELYGEPDGRFPNHHPDPTVMEYLEDLITKVRETGADIGIGWDGDADRIGAVDEQGNVIFGDMLLLLFARAILEEVPKATIIGDVKCSSVMFDDLRQRGANAVMYKTGHSLIKHKLKELNGELGGEMSGHIFFKHRFYGFDDAVYASARLIEILSKTDKPASELLADLPPRVSTPEIRVECPDEIKFEIAARAQKAFPEFATETIDGVRISFAKGWGLIRASNTQPVLVMRFEAETSKDLEAYRSLTAERVEQIKAALR